MYFALKCNHKTHFDITFRHINAIRASKWSDSNTNPQSQKMHDNFFLLTAEGACSVLAEMLGYTLQIWNCHQFFSQDEWN